MAEEWFWLLLSASEILLVLVLLLFVAWLRGIAAQRRDRKAIQALVAKTRKHRDQRVAKIAAFLGDGYGLKGEPLNAAVTALYQAEVGLIQAFATIYSKRDATAAAGFGGQVEAGTSAYWELEGGTEQPAGEESASSAEAGPDAMPLEDDGEMDRLRGENERLSDELRITMDTMSRMLSEYSTVFSKDGEAADITVVDDAPSESPPATVEAIGDEGDGVSGANADEGGDAPGPSEPDGTDEDSGKADLEPDAEASAAPPAPNPDDILADLGLDPEPEPAAESPAEGPGVEDETEHSAVAAEARAESTTPPAPNPDDILADMGLDPEPAAGSPAEAPSAEDVAEDEGTEPAAGVESGAPATPNPDDILADLGLDPESEPAATADRFSADLDETEKDLSDTAPDERGPAPEQTEAEKAAAERQRIIDADS